MTLQNQLQQILQDLKLVSVETTLMAGAIVLLVSGLASKQAIVHKGIFLITLLVSLYFSITQSDTGTFLSKSLFLTPESAPFISLFLLMLGLVLVFPRNSAHSTEFYFFILAIGAGAILALKANSLLIAYLAIELISFTSYILTSFSFKRTGHEAAIKYLLFGAVSSVIMLFGLAIIYGTSGLFHISDWGIDTFDQLPSQIGLLFFIFGLFFKISIFPFHIWTPATYQTMPADAVAILSIVPKLSVLLLLKRTLINSSLPNDHWIYSICIWMGIFTILLGTLGALRQSNSRRMISFGAIAHSGFLLPFALIIGDTSEQAFWWYAVVYSMMNIGVFYLIERFESKEIYDNKSYAFVSQEVWMGVAFTLILLSLAGLPPLAGFTAKFFLFSVLWESYLLSGSSLHLVYLMVAIVATVGSLFFYLRIPYFLFVKSEKEPLSRPVNFSSSTKIIATIFTIALLLLFFVPKLIVMMHTLLNQHS